MRRLSTAVAAAVLAVIGLLSSTTGAAAASSPAKGAKTPAVRVVKISGSLDPILASFLANTVRDASRDGSLAVVLRVNSSGSVISDGRLRSLARVLHDSDVPIIAWVGPANVSAEGAMAQLLAVVDEVGIAPGGRIGKMGEPVVPTSMWSAAFVEHRNDLRDGTMDADSAARAGLTVPTKDALVLRRMLLRVPGFHAKSTSTVTATPIEFAQLSTGSNLMHTFASPAVAQLMFVIGLCLILFELFTAGIGVAGVTGAAFLIFGCYGLGVLPVRTVAVAMILGSMVAFAVDVQVGTPRFWTVVGSALVATGFVTLYQGIAIPWVSTVGGIVGVVLFMVYAMPAVTRSRFSTPVIDRQWLVGREGTVETELSPVGTVRIGDGLWAARAVDGDLVPGSRIRVASVDGVLCRAEPVSAV